VQDQHDTIIWISGATQGIGEALARTCPYPDAAIVNISRRQHPEYESIVMDLTDPATWSAVTDDFERRLADFTGARAIFIHNAFWHRWAYAGEGDPGEQYREVMANVASPLVLGEAFLRAAGPAVDAGVDVGLVQMSSGSARLVYPGMACYGAAKASMEQWVRNVRSERAHRGKGPWVIAVRPGFVDTPAARDMAGVSPEDMPWAQATAESLDTGEGVLEADDCAGQIWAALPPTGERSVLWFGEAVGAES
jgi:benzil reductase ((S)-benzoin forming)